MMTIQELKRYAQALGIDAFVDQQGPFVLVQSPPPEAVQQIARLLGARATFKGEDLRGAGMAEMISKFDSLQVAFLPTVGARDRLTIGRAPDNELVIDDPTVSKRHACIRWEHGCARLEDLESRNGTYVNGTSARRDALPLSDGDYLNFGEASFLFFRAETLYYRLLGTDETSFQLEEPRGRSTEIEIVSLADSLWA